MADIEDAPRLRELCEKASKEFDHDRLIDLVRQINDLLEKKREQEQKPGGEEDTKGSPLLWGVVRVSMMAKSADEWLELYPWIAPART